MIMFWEDTAIGNKAMLIKSRKYFMVKYFYGKCCLDLKVIFFSSVIYIVGTIFHTPIYFYSECASTNCIYAQV